MKDLSIIVVTFNEEQEILQDCFASISASVGLDWELLVIDNGKRAATKKLAESIPNCRYISNPDNKGFAYAVNQGMKLSGGRHVLLLNPDTQFLPDALAGMVRKIDAEGNIGIASCVIRYPDGLLQESIRRFPSIADQLLILFKVPHLLKTKTMDYYLMRDVDPLQTQDVDSIMGACMFIRRELMEDIGLFDEQYFLWYEEVDYCKMAREAGWRIVHIADIQVIHHKGHAFGKIETLRKQRWVRESLRKYMKKHHGMWAWLLFLSLTPVFIGLAYFTAILKRR